MQFNGTENLQIQQVPKPSAQVPSLVPSLSSHSALKYVNIGTIKTIFDFCMN